MSNYWATRYFVGDCWEIPLPPTLPVSPSDAVGSLHVGGVHSLLLRAHVCDSCPGLHAHNNNDWMLLFVPLERDLGWRISDELKHFLKQQEVVAVWYVGTDICRRWRAGNATLVWYTSGTHVLLWLLSNNHRYAFLENLCFAHSQDLCQSAWMTPYLAAHSSVRHGNSITLAC